MKPRTPGLYICRTSGSLVDLSVHAGSLHMLRGIQMITYCNGLYLPLFPSESPLPLQATHGGTDSRSPSSPLQEVSNHDVLEFCSSHLVDWQISLWRSTFEMIISCHLDSVLPCTPDAEGFDVLY